jgi:hypothetical protein
MLLEAASSRTAVAQASQLSSLKIIAKGQQAFEIGEIRTWLLF